MLHAPYVDRVCLAYETFDDRRKVLTPSNIESLSEPVACIPGFMMRKVPCSLDPMGFTQSEIYFKLALKRRFKMTLPERVSMIRARGIFPHTTYHFCAAAHSLLQQTNINPKHREGYNFGFFFMLLMKNIDEKIRDKKLALPPRRYSQYSFPPVPTFVDFESSCRRLLVEILFCKSDGVQVKTVSERKQAYKNLLKSFIRELPKVADLGCLHIFNAEGVLGTLPHYCTTELDLDSSTKAIKWLYENYGIPSSVRICDLYKNLSAALQTRFGCKFSFRYVENLICKIYRSQNADGKTDRLFSDLAVPDQPMFRIEAKGVSWISKNGKVTFVSGRLLPVRGNFHFQKMTFDIISNLLRHVFSMLQEVPFGGRYLPIEDARSKLSSANPSLGIPRDILRGLFMRAPMERTDPGLLLEEIPTPVVYNNWLQDVYTTTEWKLICVTER